MLNKASRWKLVVSDLDGTLLDENSLLPAENLTAVKALTEAGIGFTVATGRMDQMARLFTSQLQVKLPIIACNGAMIRQCQTQAIIQYHPMPPAAARTALHWLSRNHFHFLAYSTRQAFYPDQSSLTDYYHVYNQQAVASGLPPVDLQLLGNPDDRAGLELLKIMVRIPDAAMLAGFKLFIQGLEGCDAVLSTESGYDIMAAGVSKGQALHELAAYLGISLHEIVAIGDHDNDAPMLQAAGLGIAMGNATQAAQAASRQLTSHHQDAGFARAIFQYVLDQAKPS